MSRKYQRPPGVIGERNDPEEQYRAGYQHGVNAVVNALLSNNPPKLTSLKSWAEVDLQKWRHDVLADPSPPPVPE